MSNNLEFDKWFKTTKWFTGDNCTPKYMTYRSMLSAWNARVPEDCVLAPKEPTDDMIEAGKDCSFCGGWSDEIYMAMIESINNNYP